jgi:hypothetical protein
MFVAQAVMLSKVLTAVSGPSSTVTGIIPKACIFGDLFKH